MLFLATILEIVLALVYLFGNKDKTKGFVQNLLDSYVLFIAVLEVRNGILNQIF